MNADKIETIVRVVLSILLWVVIAILIAVTTLLMSITGNDLPVFAYWLPVIFGIFMMVVFWTEEGWSNLKSNVINNVFQQIDAQLTDKIGDLNDDELETALQKITEAKTKFGITKAKQKKKKRGDIDARLNNLSDSDLMRIKKRLADGTLDDGDINDLLGEIESQQQG